MAGGAVLTVGESRSFSQVLAGRSVSVATSDDPEAMVGLLVADTVQRNKQEVLVDIRNDTGLEVEFTVSLDDCSHGTLSGPNGSGCSVSVTLVAGTSRSIDIEAAVKDTTVPFTITGSSPTFTFEATRETSAVSGNASGAITFQKLNGFSANSGDDDWTIDKIDVRDDDGDDDLDRVEFEIEDGDGTVRATRTDTCGCNGGSKYSRQGNNSVEITPDETGYTIDSGERYKLTVRAYDADGNLAFETRETTA